MKKIIFFFLFTILLVFNLNGETLTFGIVLKEEHPLFNRTRIFLDELTAIMGGDIEIKLRPLPYERAKTMLVNGKIDGDFGRTLPVYRDEPDVFLVAHSILRFKYFCYTNLDLTTEDFLLSIRNRRLVIERGNVMVTKYAEVNNLKSTFITSIDQAFKMIDAGRGDFYIGGGELCMILQTDEFKESGIKKLTPHLFTSGTYLFLHKKHKHLVTRFEKALKELSAVGRTAEIYGF